MNDELENMFDREEPLLHFLPVPHQEPRDNEWPFEHNELDEEDEGEDADEEDDDDEEEVP